MIGDGALGGEENHEVKVARAIIIGRVEIEKVRSASFFGSRLPDGYRLMRMGQRSVRVNPLRRSIQHLSETTLGCQKSRPGDDLLMFF